ncbi:hypothetical protein HanXRQr2_Chr14g0643951 [Helianthus annuus]|uniref:Uncharacterized protein n=1 Tax=Helianthus annuus TaxID=4232 RepID=A0A9K3EA32_HELAN|nr:hypothetical protein HanXRQr2_Chr14g0643951 [Helianthus annuus]
MCCGRRWVFFFARAQLSQVSFRAWSDYSTCMTRSDYNKRLGSFKRNETNKLICWEVLRGMKQTS